jgi:hypothetical protein
VIRQLDTWVLTAEWFDGDALRHGHAYFATKRDAMAVGRHLKAEGPEEFTFVVEKAEPWESSLRTGVAIEAMAYHTGKEWDL